MPTYEYECSKCGHSFEKFQSMSDPVIKKCPKCKKLAAKRLISAGAGIIFKGSGFYCTDYKKKTPKDEKPADSKKSTQSSQGCSSCKTSSCSSCKK